MGYHLPLHGQAVVGTHLLPYQAYFQPWCCADLHLPCPAGTPLFFLLSQILQDPWQVKLQMDAASDFAWVSIA